MAAGITKATSVPNLVVQPDQLTLVTESSDPLAPDGCFAGLTLHDLMCLGLSPLVFRCNEAWCRIGERLATVTGYEMTFVLDTGQASDEVMAENPWASRDGTLTFRKHVH